MRKDRGRNLKPGRNFFRGKRQTSEVSDQETSEFLNLSRRPTLNLEEPLKDDRGGFGACAALGPVRRWFRLRFLFECTGRARLAWAGPTRRRGERDFNGCGGCPRALWRPLCTAPQRRTHLRCLTLPSARDVVAWALARGDLPPHTPAAATAAPERLERFSGCERSSAAAPSRACRRVSSRSGNTRATTGGRSTDVGLSGPQRGYRAGRSHGGSVLSPGFG